MPPRSLVTAAVAAFVTAFVAPACGTSSPPADTAPACGAVAEHLVRLAERDNLAAADPELRDGMRAELDRQCRASPWTAERRRCLAAARSQDATLRCPER